MSIPTEAQFTQHEPNEPAGTRTYPVTLYTAPVLNVGNPEAPGHRMLHTDLRYLFERVRDGDSEWAPDPRLIARLHTLAPHKGEKGHDRKATPEADEYENIKKYELPFSVPGHYQRGHRHSPDPQKPSRDPNKQAHADRFRECRQYGAHPPIAFACYKFVELDNIDAEALAAERERLKAQPSVIAVWLSAGGRGLHIFVRLDTAPTNDLQAHAAYEVVVQELGFADSVSNDGSVKNLCRLAFVPHDPDAWWNPNDPVPLVWKVPEPGPTGGHSGNSADAQTRQSHGQARNSSSTGESTSGGKSRESEEQIPPPEGELRQQFEDVARALMRLGLNYNDWYGLLGTLRSAGFSDAKLDSISREGPQYQDGEVEQKSSELRPSDNPARTINGMANRLGLPRDLRIRDGCASNGSAGTANSGGRRDAKGNGKKAKPPAPPPKPSWDTLTPDYQAAWLAFVAHDALVVVWDPAARARDGNIEYRLLAVDEKTGLLDDGELMTRYRVRAAKAYIAACVKIDDAKLFGHCCQHAREIRTAANARKIADNVGASTAMYPDVWKGIPVYMPYELDADLSVIGTPAGVWSIPDHQFMSAAEARERLCTTAIRWDYDVGAAHPVALKLFKYLYGDLQDTTTLQFARWRQAATALVRHPEGEIIVKISPTGSAKTTEGNVQVNAFAPLVVEGERPAIEQPSPYATGGTAHNSYLANFRRPARRINIPEISSEDGKKQRAVDSQRLRDLSEKTTISYRDPGPHPAVTVPFSAHLFLDGNIPQQGQDLLQISNPDSDSAAAVRRRLRGSPYEQIPVKDHDKTLVNYGNPDKPGGATVKADVEAFNRTIVKLMLDGMAQHYKLLMEPLPVDDHSRQVIDDLQNLGQAEWLTEWMPHALKPTKPGEDDTHTLAIYQSYLDWHDDNGEGRPVSRRRVSEAVKKRYGLKLGAADHHYLNGKRTATNYCLGWTLATPAMPGEDAWF